MLKFTEEELKAHDAAIWNEAADMNKGKDFLPTSFFSTSKCNGYNQGKYDYSKELRQKAKECVG
jgi:hypothetical protein